MSRSKLVETLPVYVLIFLATLSVMLVFEYTSVTKGPENLPSFQLRAFEGFEVIGGEVEKGVIYSETFFVLRNRETGEPILPQENTGVERKFTYTAFFDSSEGAWTLETHFPVRVSLTAVESRPLLTRHFSEKDGVLYLLAEAIAVSVALVVLYQYWLQEKQRHA